ncbi:hypothetical protein [Paraburkholderia youngii]|uniref:hypothetical protein n=1 Tax=Paraburkholderia youngii TaxID=2782701 RepID=UPI003D252164
MSNVNWELGIVGVSVVVKEEMEVAAVAFVMASDLLLRLLDDSVSVMPVSANEQLDPRPLLFGQLGVPSAPGVRVGGSLVSEIVRIELRGLHAVEAFGNGP